MYVTNVRTVTYSSKSIPRSMPSTSAIDCQIEGNTIENPTREGNVKSKSERNARDLEPNDLARTINAGMNRSTNRKRTMSITTPKSDLKRC